MTETLQQHVQRSTLDQILELFDIDLTPIGGALYHFVNTARQDGGSVTFGGVTYSPLPIKSDGWTRSGQGQLPRPILTLSNVTGLFSSLNLIYGDMIGVQVTRRRTFYWALDGQTDADPTAVMQPIDVFVVARKTQEDNTVVVYELATALDVEGRVFPSRVMLQNFCNHTYRRWTGVAFDYSKATCPYTGTVYRTSLGQPTSSANDSCGKTLPECTARFGLNVDLGFAGFPGIDHVRP